MNNPTASPGRSLFRGITGLFTSTAAVVNPRVSRGLVLRISLLLFARALIDLVPIPLSALFGGTVLPIALNFLQTSIGIAVVSSYFSNDGPLGAITRRLFAEKESAFISLYACFVLVLGPALSLAEAAVLVYETMRISREWEARMSSASSPRTKSTHRALILATAVSMYVIVLGAAITIFFLAGKNSALPSAIGGAGLLYFVVAFANEQSNVLEGALLSAYTAAVMLAAFVEELDVTNSGALGFIAYTHGEPRPEWRALVLIISSALALFTLHRAPLVVRIVMFGHEAVHEEPQPAVTNVQPQIAAPIVPPLALQSAGIYVANVAPAAAQSRRDPSSTVALAVAVIVVTFRVLVWSGRLFPGEYFPLYSRLFQALATFGVYIMFLRIEAADEAEEQRRAAAIAAKKQ